MKQGARERPVPPASTLLRPYTGSDRFNHAFHCGARFHGLIMLALSIHRWICGPPLDLGASRVA